MMKKLRHYLLAGLIMLLWSHALYAQTLSPPGNECSSALDFNGTNQYLDAPDGVYFGDNTFTIEAWVYPRSHGNYQRVIDFGNGDTNNNVLLAATEGTSGKPNFTVYNGSSNAGAYTANTAIPLNAWTHVAVVSTGTSVIIYLNGVVDTTYTGSPTVQAVTRTNNYIGRSNWSGDAHFDGMLDDIRIWNTPRTQSEIQAAKDVVLSGSESGLLAYWDFDELTGTTANDKTANNWNATLMNMSNTNWYLINGRVTWYADLDGDGYASSVVSCTSPGAGYSDSLGELLEGDCDDTNAAINPGKTEVMGNGIDDDCNPVTFDMRPFVTTWKTDNYGASGSNQITIPTTGSGYDYTVYWESTADTTVNGTVTGLTGNSTITFPEAGTYRVEIAGNFPRIYFNGGGDYYKIISIKQWGDIAWASMERAFQGCFNLVSTATDAPDLSGVTNMSYMFYSTQNFNGDLNNWDVSKVTNMANMFNYARSFNGDLSNWNVGSVTNMDHMFYKAIAFNGDLSTWDVSSATNMSNMFNNATAFNGDLSAWDVSKATNMSYMFSGAQNFTSNLSAWNVSNVTNMAFMFYYARSFNSDLSNWDVSSVTDMRYMFMYASAFSSDLGAWDISNITNTNMNAMLTQSGMSTAHYDATLAGWATLDAETETKIPSGIYLGATGLKYCNAANRDILVTTYDWTINGDTDISALSGEPLADKLSAIISAEAVQSLVAPQAVNYCAGDTLTAITDATLPITTTTTITWTYVDGNEGTEDITQQQHIFVGRPFVFTWEGDYAYLYGDSDYDYSYVIDWGDGAIDTLQSDESEHTYATEGPHTISVYGQFPGIVLGEESGLRSIEQWGDIEWRTMRYMFANTSPVFNATDVPNLSQVTDMSNMFSNSGFNGDISAWDVSSITNMSNMFRNAAAFNSDISAWDVSNVTNMESMFREARAFNQSLGGWNVSNVTNMTWMFLSEDNNMAFNQDISGWDVSNVTEMHGMFRGAVKFNQDISTWNVGKVTDMRAMLAYATSFDQDLSNWDISSVTNMYNMLNSNGLSISNYDATLSGWAALDPETETRIPTEVDLGANGLFYCNPAGRESLTADYGWTINGDSDASAVSGLPQQKELPVIVSDEPVTSLEAPIAINCAGDTLTAVADVALPITASTTLTWTYADGNEATEDITQQQYVYIGRPFVFTWEGDYAYLDGDSDYDYSYVIDWGDGVIDTLQSNEPEHMYATEGPHTISVYGQFPGIALGEEGGDLRSVEQWGDIEWRTMRYMFAYTRPVFNATDVPNLSQVTDMSNMFYNSGFNGDISAWDVSSVTNMYSMFRDATAFNGDISSWDVSSVTNMSYLFQNATAFNSDLSAWDVSSVISMSSMLNQSGMSAAYYDATLAGWATLGENETKIPTSISLGADGLKYCNGANRNTLATDYNWSISGDTDISGKSGDPVADKLSPIVSEEAITSLEAPIAINCAGDTLTAVADVALPITASTTITWTYADGNEATEDVTQQQHIFVGRPFVFTAETNHNQFIVQPHFDFIDQTNVVIDWGDGATSHYDGSDPYNDLPFDYHEYADQGVYTISIYGDLHGITTDFTFGGEEYLAPYLRSIEQWGDVEWKTMEGAFEGTDSLLINATDAPNLSQVTSMSGMFGNATHFNADLSAWDVSNVTDMSEMFYNASAFNGDLSNWDVSSVTDMSNTLSNSGMSVRHYEAILKGWATLGENETKIPGGVTLGAEGINYCDATGRNILVDDYGWIITDAGSYCPAPPVLAALEDKAVNEGEILSFTVDATAGELPFEYKLGAVSLAKGMTLDHTTGAFSWTPTHAQVGGHSVIVTLDDAQSTLVSDTFTITVNAAPVLADIGNQSVNEGEALTFTASVTDVDDAEFTFSLDDISVAKGMAITSSGAFSWAAVQEQVSEHSVTISVSDGKSTDEETFIITVNAVNDAPVLAAIGDKSVNESEALTFTASAADVDDAGFTFSIDDASLDKGMAITSSGAFSWMPTQAQVGEHNVTITVSDGELTDEETFTITVNAVNDAPVLAAIGGQSVNEGEALTFTASATDVDDAEFTFGLDDASVNKGMTITSSGAFSWTPVQEQVGEHSVTITVSDGELTDEETFIITVNAVNDALVISSNAGLTLTQGGTAEITSELLSVTDTDNTSTALVYTVTALPANGTLKKGETALTEHGTFTQADIDNGLISYLHDGFNGATDEFLFTVTDGSTTLTSTFAISINIVMAVEHTSIDEASLSPVPAEDVVTLRITNAYRGNVSVRLFDASGREMLTVYTVKDRAELVHAINITSIPSGVVLVHVQTGNRTQILRMIKK